MIRVQTIHNIKEQVAILLRSKVEKNSIIKNIKGYYQGSYFDQQKNTLKIAVGITENYIKGGKEVNRESTQEINIKFWRDYRAVAPKHFDAMLSHMAISEQHKNGYITFNKEELYYDIIYNVYKLFYTGLKGATPNRVNGLKDIIGTVKGVTVASKTTRKTVLHNLSLTDEAVVILDEGKKGYAIRLFSNNNSVSITVSEGGKLKLETGEYKRLPNGTSKPKRILLTRYHEGKELQEGLEPMSGAYKRAVNAINAYGAEFDTTDKDIYQNSLGKYFRIKIKENTEYPHMSTITFYGLREDRIGTKMSSYYLNSVFDGTYSDMLLDASQPDWVVDSHVLTDIYEDHIDGKYGVNGKVGNLK